MHLYQTVRESTLYGLCEILPISYSGHHYLSQLLAQPSSLAQAPQDGALEGIVSAGVALAAGVLARHRLARVLVEGVQAIARPSLFRTTAGGRDAAVLLLAAPISLVLQILSEPILAPWTGSPLAVGAGLLVTGGLLATLAFAPRFYRDQPSPLMAIALGTVAGASIYPGAARMAAMLVLLLQLGHKPAYALDLALMLSLPTLIFIFLRTVMHNGTGGIDIGMGVLGCLLSFLAAMLGCALLKALLSRRLVPLLALWLIPLGFSVLAYGRAL